MSGGQAASRLVLHGGAGRGLGVGEHRGGGDGFGFAGRGGLGFARSASAAVGLIGCLVLVLVLVGCGGAPRPTSAAAPVCPTAVARVSSAPELEALRGCAKLAGLVIRSGAALSLAPLHALVELEGELTIGPTLSLDALDLPRLARVGGAVRIAGNSALVGVFLPQLRSAARLEIEHNASLTSISLPALVETAALTVRGNAELEALTLSALQTLGTLLLDESPQLGLLLAERLAQVTRWEVGALPAMEAAQLEELRARVAP